MVGAEDDEEKEDIEVVEVTEAIEVVGITGVVSSCEAPIKLAIIPPMPTDVWIVS